VIGMHQAQQAVQVYLQMNALQSVIREQSSEVMQIEHRPQRLRDRSQKSDGVKR
jgi:hypothetical protein